VTNSFKASEFLSQRPNYHLVYNNCQEFAKSLVETICGVVVNIDTIEDVLERLYKPVQLENQQFPGTYPRSIRTGTIRTEYRTASSGFTTSLYTAEDVAYYSTNESPFASTPAIDGISVSTSATRGIEGRSDVNL